MLAHHNLCRFALALSAIHIVSLLALCIYLFDVLIVQNGSRVHHNAQINAQFQPVEINNYLPLLLRH